MKRAMWMLTEVAIIWGSIGVAHATPTIINIDAQTNHVLNPVQVFFEAGTYTLDPIGVADGGLYNAWSVGPGWGPGRYKSWVWWYCMENTELGVRIVGDPSRASDYEMDAFATAVSTTFSLSTDAYVKFYILDGPGGYQWAGDNIGGMSLRVNAESYPIPAPGAILLGTLGAGLVGYLRRHRVF